MAIEVQQLSREFLYAGQKLDDPGAHLTEEQVKTYYATFYPDLLTAAIDPAEVRNGRRIFQFRKATGSKG